MKMKLLVYSVLLLCFVNYACCQRWTRRGFRGSNWFDNSWNTQPMGFDSTWNTQPAGWFDNGLSQPIGGSTQPTGWNSQPTGWNSQPTGWNSQPIGWSGNRDSSWYRWYNWYSWQGASSLGTSGSQPSSTGSPGNNAQPTRPIASARNQNANPRPRNGSMRPSRYKRDIDTTNDIVPPNQMSDIMARDPRGAASKEKIKTTEMKCPNTYQPVCGNNNQTYDNPCELMKAGYSNECLDFAYEGQCNIDKEIVCFDCQNEDAQLSLTKNMLPSTGYDMFVYNMVVCGTDERTYSSLCHLCKRKCLDSNKQLRPEHRGHCGAPFPFGGN